MTGKAFTGRTSKRKNAPRRIDHSGRRRHCFHLGQPISVRGRVTCDLQIVNADVEHIEALGLDPIVSGNSVDIERCRVWLALLGELRPDEAAQICDAALVHAGPLVDGITDYAREAFRPGRLRVICELRTPVILGAATVDRLAFRAPLYSDFLALGWPPLVRAVRRGSGQGFDVWIDWRGIASWGARLSEVPIETIMQLSGADAARLAHAVDQGLADWEPKLRATS